MERLKLSFADSVQVRQLRPNHTINQIAKKFDISSALVGKVCHYTDTELLRAYSKHSNPMFNRVRIIKATDQTVTLRYRHDTPFAGLDARVSNYYLFNAEFVASFNTLTDASKKKLLTNALHKMGYTNVAVQRIGDDAGIDNRYIATADGKRIQWLDLMRLKEVHTILALKGEKHG